MRLNCDLGEDYGNWRIPIDEQIYHVIDQANIACGFHAGDPLAIEKAIKHAITNDLEIGAHPSYPDIQGFGRRHMAMHSADLAACLRYQISALKGLVELQSSQLSYVKLHGALYNDFVKFDSVRSVVIDTVAEFSGLSLMVQAHPDHQEYSKLASNHGLELQFEAFIDRLYLQDGSLAPRGDCDAILNPQQAVEQAKRLIDSGSVITRHGHSLPVIASTLCVHGDNPDAVYIAQQVRNLLARA